MARKPKIGSDSGDGHASDGRGVEHICRDENYSPYDRPCRACISQLSKNSWTLHAKTASS